MPHLDLDPSTFADCAAAARDAAALLHGTSGLGLPAGATGDPGVESALADLRHAWAHDVGTLAGQLDSLVSALAAAGEAFATAEADVVGALAGAVTGARGR